MNKFLSICFAVFFCFSLTVFAQIPTVALVQIVKAEDERRFDQTLINLLSSPDEKIRIRAALAAGRIGDDRAVMPLAGLLQNTDSAEVGSMALFALGEIESVKATPTIIETLNNRDLPKDIQARALEAAGKIAAANPKDEKSKELGAAILQALNLDEQKRAATSRDVVLAGLTAILRARPEGAEKVVINFLNYSDSRARADALNTLARLRAKNANTEARTLLQKDENAVVRANAARLLGVGEDKEAVDLLLKAAVEDSDSRVRVSAIRALGSLKDAKTADALLSRGGKLLSSYSSARMTSGYPKEKNELLEIWTALSRILQNSNNQKAVELIAAFSNLENHQSPETEIALARIAPAKFAELQRNKKDNTKSNWRAVNASMAGIGELANTQDSPEIVPVKEQTKKATLEYIKKQLALNPVEDKTLSDALTAYAAYKTTDLPQIALGALRHKDAVVRAAAAGILADQTATKESVNALQKAFDAALLFDKDTNDAQLALLDALFKLDKKEAIRTLFVAANSRDYLVRKKAFDLMKDESYKDSSLVKMTLEKFAAQKKNQVLPYAYGNSKNGVILNTNADYTRAVSRKSAQAVVTTAKGAFTIEFFPQAAPLTVDNFIRLAKSNYFNHLTIHRVVPNFVMQDGDPRGDGNGGPGWQIRCEINEIPYERGMLGMALSGKDTGGSQWFVTHSPQPHLDGGYTVFGRVNELDMKIVDNLVRGDKILNVRIVENVLSQRKTPRKKK